LENSLEGPAGGTKEVRGGRGGKGGRGGILKEWFLKGKAEKARGGEITLITRKH